MTLSDSLPLKNLGVYKSSLIFLIGVILFVTSLYYTNIGHNTSPRDYGYETLKNINGHHGLHSLVVGPKNITLNWDPVYHVYKFNGKPIIWMFWDKPQMPSIIALGIASIECHNPQFHLQRVSLTDVPLWIDHIHPAFKYLIPAHKADYFRARILDLYGGAYLDADSIGLGSFWHLYEKLPSYDIINISWPPDGDLISITSMGPMRGRSRFTSKWVSELHILLDQKLPEIQRNKVDSLGWAEMLRDITKPVIERLLKEQMDFSLFSVTGHTSFGQMVISGLRPEKTDVTHTGFSWTETELLMFHNSVISGAICDMTLKDFLNSSNTLLAELFRFSFRECYEKRDKPKIPPPISPLKQLSVGFPKQRIELNDMEIDWIKLYIDERKYV